jgi:molybdenum cofactor cytidylyltransferase
MNSDTEHIGSIILAAGEGRRIGGNKALLPIDGTTFLGKVADALKAIDSRPIVVVGGSEYQQVKQSAESLGVDFAHNTDWQSGQFSSLKAGIKHLKTKPTTLLITLVDHPLVKADTYKQLFEHSGEHPDCIIIPSHNGRRGHPIIIPQIIINEILDADIDSNLRVIINNHKDKIHELSVDDGGILRDIDTKADFEDIKAR